MSYSFVPSELTAHPARHADSLTVLVCQPGHIAAKTHTKTKEGIKTQGFDAGTFFTAKVVPVRNILELATVLGTIEKNTRALVIRGYPKDGLDLAAPHTRTHHGTANYSTPPQGHHHVMIDIDNLPMPAGLSYDAEKVDQLIDYAVNQLPIEFHDASCFWQLSSSAGVRGADAIKLHLWFWLSESTSDSALKSWGKAVNAKFGCNLIDCSLFNDVQAHYTARPSFIGMADPLSRRSGLKCGIRNEVALDQAVAKQVPVPVSRQSAQKAPADSSGFEYHLSCIGDHPGGDGFHHPITKAAASYVATHGAENTDVEALYEVIRDRVIAADRTHHPQEEVAQRAGRTHIMSAIQTAVAKYGDSPHRKSRLHDDASPHYQTDHLTLAEAMKRIDSAFDSIL